MITTKTNLILFVAITLSTGSLLGMEANYIRIANFLDDRSIHAQISHDKATLSSTIKPAKATRFVKLSPDGKTSLELSIMYKNNPYNVQEKIRLELEKDQNIISVLNDKDTIVIKDNNNRQILATL